MMGVVEIVTSQGSFSADVEGRPGAPTVLLLHGFPQSRHTWRTTVPLLAAGGYRAVAVDQRGYSAGVRPAEVEAYATDRLVADVLEIADVLGVERVNLVGHDWGGQVAWLTAAAHPDRVATLTVLSRPHPAAFARSFALDGAQAERSRHHRRMTGSVADRWWADDRAALRTMLLDSGVPEADATAYLSVFAERAGLEAAMNWYRAAAAGDGLAAASTPDVVVPALYLWGDADQTVGRTAAELTAEHVSGPYRFVVIPGGGHFLTDDGSAGIVDRELLAHLAAHT